MQQAAILEAFADLPDPRRKAGQRHSISLCLALFTLAIAAGNRGFLAIGDWIDAYQSELIELLGVDQQRLPSYSTIRRVLLQLDYQKYAQCIVKFLGLQNVNEERIAVYSKALQKYTQPDSSNFNLEPHPAINLVSSFLAERGLMLETSEVDAKPYGIKGLPETIKTMALKGVTFALDAIRAQPKTSPDS
ncbi:transposase family protein [Oscillatoria salina]|uniref:transposase family protein n=1 Tax=Oscillatoria salina TaxID=331517 RepID=UPI0013B7A095|nr:transposase family protein [Oscillatoria salina]MBZ8180584.1 transposase family protein [Oscillatoria salina IIICB1]NET91048.1 transposase family protein [Kamptonema sp. SIO1D9]